MTASARALACPPCGGPLVLLPGQRIARCPWCDSLQLVHSVPVIARFLARPRHSADDALGAMVGALAHPALRRGLDGRARIARPRLFFIPFYELRARRAGRARIDRDVAPAGGFEEELLGASVPSPSSHRHHPGRPVRPRQLEENTKVVLASWSFFWPAVELPGWGLAQIEAQRLRAGDGPALERFDMVAADRTGTAFEPTVDPEAFRAAALRAAPTRTGDVKVIEEHLSVLYYPIWRASYLEGGRAFSVSLDAIDGSVLRLTGPSSRERAATRVVATSAAAGGLGGVLAHLARDLARGLAATPARSAAPLPALVALLLVAGAGAVSYLAAEAVAGSSEVVLVRRSGVLEQQ